MWVADGENGGGNQIDRIPPDSPTSITRFDIPTPGANPIGIAAGADGNLWFVEQSASKLGRITTSGVITEWPTLSPKASPIGIAPGADGNMWFTESNGAKVGRITPDGAISEFPLDAGFGQPQGIVAGPDGNMWVAELDGPGIGEVTPSGDVTSFVTPTVPSGPTGICLGPDGNLWFTEESTGFIGELEDAQPQTAYVQSTAGGFSPPTVTAAQGVAVQWTFMGPTAQSVSDRSGLELFDSPSQLPVSYFSHTFTAAGTYGYMDAGGVSSGRIEVPVIAAPSSGGEETTFTITWASAPPPAGLVLEVQIKRPSTGWANWQDGVTNTSATFLPDGGTGTYGFRSRLVDPITHAHIAWSATIGISVS
jgi:plastocyanin